MDAVDLPHLVVARLAAGECAVVLDDGRDESCIAYVKEEGWKLYCPWIK